MAKKTTTKKKKVSGERIEHKKNAQGKINFRIIARNGRLLADIRQGHERIAGMNKNLLSLKDFFSRFDLATTKIIDLNK